MSQKKKKQLRRKIAQCVGHQMKTVVLLAEVAEVFRESHQDYAEMFTTIANNCMITIEWIKGVAIHAWGYFPDDINTWLK
jgi:hypothetical protein